MKKTPFTSAIITRFFQGELGSVQHQQVLDWLATLSRAEQEDFFNAHLDFLDEHANPEANQVPATGFQEVREEIERKLISRKMTITWGLRVAAALFPLLLIYFLFQQPQQKFAQVAQVSSASDAIKKLEIRNDSRKNKEIILPDSSVVTLHPGAAIEYTNVFVRAKRELNLSGKAFFNVTHDAAHPFIVHTGEVQTVVLGTSFWIDAAKAANHIRVTVKTGKVGVMSNRNATVYLLPSEVAVFTKVTGTLAKVNGVKKKVHAADSSDNTEAIAFNQTPLHQVIKVLEEQFHIELSLNDEALSGQFITLNTKGKSLKTILKEINAQTSNGVDEPHVILKTPFKSTKQN